MGCKCFEIITRQISFETFDISFWTVSLCIFPFSLDQMVPVNLKFCVKKVILILNSVI